MRLIPTLLLLLHFGAVSAQTQEPLSITLESVNYSYPVNFLNLRSEGQDIRMAYMDVHSDIPNGSTVILLHGKNFAGYYWENVIQGLNRQGYRVVVPDQVGFGKSSKPFMHYSFHQLAGFTRQLMDSLNVRKAVILGHSMGGMLATRFALMYPDRTQQLILENPIGLEDYRSFVPYADIETLYKSELRATPQSIRAYYESSYFVKWKAEYDELVRIASGVGGSSEFPRYARVAALTSQMIYEQPVMHEFHLIKVPTLILIGTQDKTVVGKARLAAENQNRYGRYEILGKQTAAKIPGSKLIEFQNSGHIPHLEIPDIFMKSLLENISRENR